MKFWNRRRHLRRPLCRGPRRKDDEDVHLKAESEDVDEEAEVETVKVEV